MIKILEKLRNKIDIIDNKIFDLINKRLKKVIKISKIKFKYQIPSYIKEREKDMLNIKMDNNNREFVSKELINDILKRIMYESYNIENKYLIYKNNKYQKIGFICINSEIGEKFKKLFIDSKYKIYNIDFIKLNKKNYIILKKINSLIISIPTYKFNNYIKDIIRNINKDCIIINLSSNKLIQINKILFLHKGPVLGLHTMFDSNIESVTKQTIIFYYKNDCKIKYNWIINQLKLWGVNLLEINCKNYNLYTSYNQSLIYFIIMSYGIFLKDKKIKIDKLFNYSTLINKLYLSILGNFFSNNINLYLEILFFNNNNINLIKDYINFLQNLLLIYNNKNKNNIIKKFNNTKNSIKNINVLCKLNNLLIKNINIFT